MKVPLHYLYDQSSCTTNLTKNILVQPFTDLYCCPCFFFFLHLLILSSSFSQIKCIKNILSNAHNFIKRFVIRLLKYSLWCIFVKPIIPIRPLELIILKHHLMEEGWMCHPLILCFHFVSVFSQFF